MGRQPIAGRRRDTGGRDLAPLRPVRSQATASGWRWDTHSGNGARARQAGDMHARARCLWCKWQKAAGAISMSRQTSAAETAATRLRSRAAADRPPSQPALSRPAWWAPNGFAAIPTAALDPPHSAASPAVPALVGSGSPSWPPAAPPWRRPACRRLPPVASYPAASAAGAVASQIFRNSPRRFR